MTHLYIFGDSIVQGAWDPFGGWVQRVRTILDKYYFNDPDKHCITYNLGLTGQTSENLLPFFRQRMEDRHDRETDIMLLFAIGINDAQIDIKSGTPTVALQTYEDNIRQIIETARSYSDKIGFIGLNPVQEDIANPLSWAPGKAQWNTILREYNESLKMTCAEQSVKLMDIWAEWQENDYTEWLSDGVHPNETGHQKIAKAVITSFLKPLGWYVPEESENGYICLS